MALPLIPIAAALLAGGSLVPHAAGGMIVTSAIGYVAGTYLSTSVISGLVVTATATVGTGLVLAAGTLKGIAENALVKAKTTSVKSDTADVLKTPSLLLVTVGGGAVLGLGYGAYRLYKLKHKVTKTPEGKEAQFTENEAKMVETIIKRLVILPKPENGGD